MATSAFGKAFAEARKAGDKEFSFNGKQYTTAMKGERKPPAVVSQYMLTLKQACLAVVVTTSPVASSRLTPRLSSCHQT